MAPGVAQPPQNRDTLFDFSVHPVSARTGSWGEGVERKSYEKNSSRWSFWYLGVSFSGFLKRASNGSNDFRWVSWLSVFMVPRRGCKIHCVFTAQLRVPVGRRIRTFRKQCKKLCRESDLVLPPDTLVRFRMSPPTAACADADFSSFSRGDLST